MMWGYDGWPFWGMFPMMLLFLVLKNLGSGDVYWDCQYRTFAACYPNALADRGFCNVNPWPVALDANILESIPRVRFLSRALSSSIQSSRHSGNSVDPSRHPSDVGFQGAVAEPRL